MILIIISDLILASSVQFHSYRAHLKPYPLHTGQVEQGSCIDVLGRTTGVDLGPLNAPSEHNHSSSLDHGAAPKTNSPQVPKVV